MYWWVIIPLCIGILVCGGILAWLTLRKAKDL